MNKNQIIFQPEAKYVKLYKNSIKSISQYLTHPEITILLRLMKYVCYEDCVLRTNGNTQGNCLSIKQIGELENIKYDTIRKIINSLKDKKVMAVHFDDIGHKYYTINPFIAFRGRMINTNIMEFYTDSVWATIDSEEEDKNDKVYQDISKFLRTKLDSWKKESSKFCNYKCVITGKEFGHIHHVFPFNRIVDNILENFDIYQDRGQDDILSIQELQIIENGLYYYHGIYGYGACLQKDIHELFHKVYGYKDFAFKEFLIFVDDIKNGKYENWFKSHDLNIDINANYVDYILQKYYKFNN